MHDGLKKVAILCMCMIAALCGCDDDDGGGDGGREVRCDGTSDGFCPCSSAENAGRRYLFCPDVVTWEEADANCKSFGYELAKIESAEEQEFVWSIAAETEGDYWIGLTDRETEGTFVWTDGTELGAYANWATEQPDSGDGEVEEDCVELLQIENGGWNDRNCDIDYLDYICERPAT